MGLTGKVAAIRGGPGTRGETAAEAVLAVVTLVVVGEEPGTCGGRELLQADVLALFSKGEAGKGIFNT